MSKGALKLSREELTIALRNLRKLIKPAAGVDATLSHSDGFLKIVVGEAVVEVAAKGSWPSDFLISAKSLTGLSRYKLDNDPVVLITGEGSLQIDKLSIPFRSGVDG